MKAFKSLQVFSVIILVFSVFLLEVKPLSASANTGDETIVTFPDPALEEKIREELGKEDGDITAADMTQIFSLEASSAGINNLEGLQYATNLSTLYLTDNNIEDFSVLQNLSSLKSLHIALNEISDISGIEKLVNLDYLQIYKNQITDLSSLSSLPNLTYLNISDNLIADISPLLNLGALSSLYLDDNPIQGQEQIEIAYALNEKGVNVHFEGVIAPISLTVIDITESTAKAYWGYNGWTTYSSFKLYNNNRLIDEFGANEERSFMMTRLSPATQYTVRVEGVNANGDVINSIEYAFTTDDGPSGDVISFPDKNLTTAVKKELGIVNRDIFSSDISLLKTLFADEEGIHSLSGIEQAYGLTYLRLSNNNIQDVSSVEELNSLTILELTNNNITDLSSFSKLTKINSLLLDDNNISNLTPISNLIQLYSLNIKNNNVTNLEPIKSLKDLGTFNAGGNPIGSFEPIHNLIKLKHLYLDDTGLDDISFLDKFTELRTLSINNNSVSDIAVLENLPNLQSVSIVNNKLDLSEGSDDYQVIQRLVDKGIDVDYRGDTKYLKIVKTTDNSILVDWSELLREGEFTSFKLYLNRNVVTLSGDTTQYTFENLNPSTVYGITLEAFKGENLGHGEYTFAQTLPPSQDNPGQSIPGLNFFFQKSIVQNGIATMPGLELAEIQEGSNVYVDLSKENKVHLNISRNQVKNLKEHHATLGIIFPGGNLLFSADNLLNDREATIVIEKISLTTDEKVVSNIYDFSVVQGGKIISTFSKPVKLAFYDLDLTKVKNTEDLKVYYFNESTEEWEAIGGKYREGTIIAETNHFSIYAVLEKPEQTSNDRGGTGAIGKKDSQNKVSVVGSHVSSSKDESQDSDAFDGSQEFSAKRDSQNSVSAGESQESIDEKSSENKASVGNNQGLSSKEDNQEGKLLSKTTKYNYIYFGIGVGLIIIALFTIAILRIKRNRLLMK
ncbi:leucine-rich repeat domain-containing protein [Robertmurraya sp. Marseille-Q9965]